MEVKNIMTTTIQNQNTKIEILDGIHYETNPIKEFILTEVNDDFYTDFSTDSLLGFNELKSRILELINKWSTFDHWSSELVYNSKLLKFYEEHEEFINNYMYESSEQQGISYTQLLDSINRDGTKITDIYDIKIYSTIYVIESNSFTLHEELYEYLKEVK
jgi:hypothetical protein|tara:strand:- start:704 stop:1183 length:480 start_codon:yes stop_codon:yes gene_type:complete